MKRRSYIPAIVMLFAGLMACIITWVNGYYGEEALLIILFTLVIFYFIGIIISIVANKCLTIEKEDKKKETDNEAEVESEKNVAE